MEKPPLAVAKLLREQGGLWNTLVLVGRLRAFWKQFARRMPKHTALFEQYVTFRAAHLDCAAGDALLSRLYRSMPVADFSRAILQSAIGLGVVPLAGSGWCDCGTPERLLSCLDDRTANEHPRMLEAILRSIQAEHGLQQVPSTREVETGTAGSRRAAT